MLNPPNNNARRRISRWWWLLASPVALGICGASWQWAQQFIGAQRFPAPGQMVDVGGRRLHLLCAGRGAPTVILEPSGLGVVLQYRRSWRRCPFSSAYARAIAPDRAGASHRRIRWTRG